MNKYLEKIAFVKEVKQFRGAATGAVVGGSLGATAGYSQKETQDSIFSKVRKMGKTERVLNGIGGGIAGAYFGGAIGLGRDIKMGRVGTHSNGYHRYSRGAGGEGFSRGKTISDIHKDLGASGGFKTKSEAQTHFRRQASKWHPDKHMGPTKDQANKEMQKINSAWTQFKSHPEGFEKLANAYLVKAAAINVAKLKALVKANPGVAIGGSLGAADGALSTTKSLRDSEIRYRLRQLRNVGVGAGVGAAIGAGAQKLYNQVA